ncbi:YtpI family protein [Nosocomiicoccus massiliensis]|uniref:YtpI family protein n=1 Tax=Nosocomiicoccus massiliensis TaxID=1232430 RepID=UPI00040D4EA5|nr:YtpI family protein [Nosocomiicoccus massiliensis]
MSTGFQLLITTLVTALIVSFLMFFIYKVRQIRTKRDVRKAYYNAMARLWFGVFLIIFGTNSIVQFNTLVTYIIGGIFIVLGIINVTHFNKARKYFKSNLPIEDEAYDKLNKQ